MDMKKFIFWDLLGCVVWSFEFLSAGYIFGSSLSLARLWLGHITIFLAFIFLLFLMFYAIKFLIIKNGKGIWLFQKSIFYFIKTNPNVINFTQKHSKIFNIISKRFDINSFYGLPLTLLSFSFIYLYAVFIGILLDVVHFGQMAQFDMMFANLLASFRKLTLVKIFLFITALGLKETIVVFLINTIILLMVWRRYNYIFPLILSVISSTSITHLIKYLVHRPRPAAAVYHAHFYSFPSGHATIAVAFYGFIAYILIREIKELKIKLNIFFAAFIVIFLIGLSRVYLCVHYFSDVWEGYIVGALGLVIGITLNEYYLFIKKEDKKIINSTAKTVSVAFVAVSVGFYVYSASTFHPKLLKLPKEKNVIISNVTDIFSNKNLKYTYTILGACQEPLNFIIMAKNDQSLKKAINRAGWYFADKLGISSIEKFIKSFMLGKPYPKAPISPDFWDYKVNNFGIEKPLKNVKVRHHGRIWETPFIANGYRIYVATDSFDEGFGWVMHKINPNIDSERRFFFKCLENAEVIKKYKLIQLTKPLIGENFYGDQFFTDGKAYMIWIKD